MDKQNDPKFVEIHIERLKKEDENIITVDYLVGILTRLRDKGYGSMKLKAKDGLLHRGEIIFNYLTNTVELKGNKYEVDINKRSQELENKITEAIEMFYRNDN